MMPVLVLVAGGTVLDVLVRILHFLKVRMMLHDLLIVILVAHVLAIIGVIQVFVHVVPVRLLIVRFEVLVEHGSLLEVQICLSIALASQSCD